MPGIHFDFAFWSCRFRSRFRLVEESTTPEHGTDEVNTRRRPNLPRPGARTSGRKAMSQRRKWIPSNPPALVGSDTGMTSEYRVRCRGGSRTAPGVGSTPMKMVRTGCIRRITESGVFQRPPQGALLLSPRRGGRSGVVSKDKSASVSALLGKGGRRLFPRRETGKLILGGRYSRLRHRPFGWGPPRPGGAIANFVAKGGSGREADALVSRRKS